MWNHLTTLHSQTNASRKFELESEMARLEQGDKDISSYYQAAVHLWTEHDLLLSSSVTATESAAVLQERASSRLMTFLMKLRTEFESIRASLLHRNVTKIADVLGELLREETRLRSQAKLEIHSAETGTVFAVQSGKPQFHRTPSGEIICHFCHEPGHILLHCKKRNICNYCKKTGHMIGACPILARRGRARTVGGSFSSGGSQVGSSSIPAFATEQVDTSASLLSQDAIRRMVQDAIKEALPTALTSVFAAGMHSRSGFFWHLDSAAFNHMTSSRSSFEQIRPGPRMELQVANGTRIPVQGIGTVVNKGLQLPDTLYVPQLVPNLVSVGQLVDDGCRIIFDANGCVVQDTKTGMEIGRGSKHGRVFSLDHYSHMRDNTKLIGINGGFHEKEVVVHSSSLLESSGARRVDDSLSFVPSQNDCSSYSVALTDWELWHRRLGHPNSSRLLAMFKNKWLSSRVVSDPGHDCIHCIQAKISQNSFISSSTVYSEPFDLVHTDLWGPSPVTSRVGFRYFALFIDHATRYSWVYFLRQKSDLLSIAKEFLQMVQTQFGRSVKVIRSDPGGEFTSHSLRQLFRDHGVLAQQSCPGVSQQNELVERKHRHVLELVRAILFHSQVPARFWVEAVHTVVYLINRQITQVLQQRSPYHVLYSKLPNYGWLRVFGCVCYVLLPSRERNKLTPKAIRCVFVGYSDIHKGYVCYDVENQRVRISCHVVFLEHLFYYGSSDKDASCDLDFLHAMPIFPEASAPPHNDDDPPFPASASESSPSSSYSSTSSGAHSSSIPSRTTSDGGNLSSESLGHPSSVTTSPRAADYMGDETGHINPPPRRSLRANKGKTPSHLADFVAYSTGSIFVPATYKQAKGLDPWEAAMATEFHALEEAHTWDIVDRRLEYLVLGSKWVFTLKMHPDGSIDRYKARLVAQGCKQEYGIDYTETFAPVAKMQTVRCLLAVAVMKGWPLLQLDIKNAFLNGDLHETVYMELPAGYSKGDSSKVCLLRRSLYGLKQAPRAWFEKLHSIICQIGFVQSENDPSLFIRQSIHGLTVLLIYVDDMVVSGDDSAGIRELTQALHAAFNLKELGDLSYFLGLEVHRTKEGLMVGQRKYIIDLLESACMDDCVSCSTPMEQNLKLRQTDGDLLTDGSQYRSLVGSLIYLTHTRPVISYAVQVVSQFMTAPRTTHLAAVHRILRYLQGTQHIGLFFPATGEPVIEAYADADYAGCLDTRRSTSGWCIKMGHSFIAWRCKKQDRIAKSSTEAEYRSMSEVTSELVWLHRLLVEFGVECQTPMQLFADNTSAIRIATNPVLHDRTKHIEVHVHYIRQLVAEGLIELSYITSEDQTADLLTKAVSKARHWFLAHKLMLRQQHQFEGGC
ncbi:Retrovirus-related Pol polyprotein from transposon TNT 1-94 [Linum grandiflorum]